AGREAEQGEVLLQTYQANHPVMQALCGHDRDRLMALEQSGREQAAYPPFGRMAAVIVEGPNEQEVQQLCRKLASTAPHRDGVRVLGPAPAPISLLRGRYRYRFLLLAGKQVAIQELLREWIQPID